MKPKGPSSRGGVATTTLQPVINLFLFFQILVVIEQNVANNFSWTSFILFKQEKFNQYLFYKISSISLEFNISFALLNFISWITPACNYDQNRLLHPECCPIRWFVIRFDNKHTLTAIIVIQRLQLWPQSAIATIMLCNRVVYHKFSDKYILTIIKVLSVVLPSQLWPQSSIAIRKLPH